MKKGLLVILTIFLCISACTHYGEQTMTPYSCNDMNWVLPLNQQAIPIDSRTAVKNRVFAASGTVFVLPWLWMDYSAEKRAALRPYRESQSAIADIAKDCRVNS